MDRIFPIISIINNIKWKKQQKKGNGNLKNRLVYCFLIQKWITADRNLTFSVTTYYVY